MVCLGSHGVWPDRYHTGQRFRWKRLRATAWPSAIGWRRILSQPLRRQTLQRSRHRSSPTPAPVPQQSAPPTVEDPPLPTPAKSKTKRCQSPRGPRKVAVISRCQDARDGLIWRYLSETVNWRHRGRYSIRQNLLSGSHSILCF
jgi:hypothetical protein